MPTAVAGQLDDLTSLEHEILTSSTPCVVYFRGGPDDEGVRSTLDALAIEYAGRVWVIEAGRSRAADPLRSLRPNAVPAMVLVHRGRRVGVLYGQPGGLVLRHIFSDLADLGAAHAPSSRYEPFTRSHERR